MKHMKKFLALALVAVTILAVAVPAMALPGSYKPYLGGDGTTHNIRRGQIGPHVKNLQMLLNATLGTDLTLDGNFGQATEFAVRTFQRDYLGSWADDGIVGPITKNTLWYNCPVWPNLVVVYPQYQ